METLLKDNDPKSFDEKNKKKKAKEKKNMLQLSNERTF